MFYDELAYLRTQLSDHRNWLVYQMAIHLRESSWLEAAELSWVQEEIAKIDARITARNSAPLKVVMRWW